MTTSLSTSQPSITRRRVMLFVLGLIGLLYLAFYLIDLQLDYNQLLSPCSGSSCNYLAISAAEVAVLQSWGLSTQVYAIIMTASAAFTVVIYWLLAGLILWRQGDSRIGLAVSLALIVMPIATIADADNVAANYPGLLLPTLLLSIFGTVILLLFLYLFPNGQFVPRWTPIPLVGTILVVAIVTLDFNGIISLAPTASEGFLVVFILIIFFSIAFQIYRYRQVSSPIERQQTKWVLIGLIIVVLGFPVWGFFFGGWVEFPAGEVRLLGSLGGWLLSMVQTLVLPIAITIAILRYRLWDIDLIIRKTLIYFVLTATLTLIFLGSVVVLQSLFATFLGERNTALVTVGSTLVVAALFNPLRRRVQNFIDRRFYRQRYNTEQVMAAFSTTLRDEVDLDHLQRSVLGVIEETMQPASVSMWLREGGGRNNGRQDERPSENRSPEGDLLQIPD